MTLHKRESGFIPMTDGIQIYYERTQLASHYPPVLLLHGLGGDLGAWEHERAQLDAASISTVAIDLRGHGLSTRPLTKRYYATHRFSQDVLEVIAYLKLVRPIVVGHCFGGVIGIYTAAMTSTPLSKLVLIDSSFKPPTISSYLHNESYAYRFFELIAHLLPMRHAAGHRNFSKYSQGADWDIGRIFSDVRYTSLRSYFYASQEMYTHNIGSKLHFIHIPTLIIQGEEDSIVPLTVAREMHHRIIHSRLTIIPHGNHIVVLSNPQNVTGLIERFVKNI